MIKNKIILLLYTCLICLFPSSIKLEFLSYSKIIFSFSLLLMLYNLFFDRKNLKKIFLNNTIKLFTIGFIILFSFITISTLINSIINNKWILSNFFEPLRVIQYFLILVNYCCFFNNSCNIKLFERTIIGILLFMSLLGITQYFNLFNLNNFYVKLIAPTQYVTLLENYTNPRIVALAGNPNVLGFFLSLGIIYLIYLAVKKNFKWYYYIIILFLNIIMFMTLSRTAYICLLAGELLFCFFISFKFNIVAFKKTIIYISIILLFNFLLLLILPQKLTWRIKQLVYFNEISSWQERVNNNKEYWNYYNDVKDEVVSHKPTIPNNGTSIKQNTNNEYILLFGNGPDKLYEKHPAVFDNEWLMFLFRYGYFGVVSFIFMLIIPLFNYKNIERKDLALYIAIISMIFIYMIPAATYHCDLLFSFCCMLLAYCIVPKEVITNEKI